MAADSKLAMGVAGPMNTWFERYDYYIRSSTKYYPFWESIVIFWRIKLIGKNKLFDLILSSILDVTTIILNGIWQNRTVFLAKRDCGFLLDCWFQMTVSIQEL